MSKTWRFKCNPPAGSFCDTSEIFTPTLIRRDDWSCSDTQGIVGNKLAHVATRGPDYKRWTRSKFESQVKTKIEREKGWENKEQSLAVFSERQTKAGSWSQQWEPETQTWRVWPFQMWCEVIWTPVWRAARWYRFTLKKSTRQTTDPDAFTEFDQ